MLYIFDFDRTITLDHTCRLALGQTPCLADPNLFKCVIQHLRTDHYVAIASYGRKQMILETMIRIFGEDNPFNNFNVITPSDISLSWPECQEPPFPHNKNSMIKLLRERFTPVIDPVWECDAILIDDSFMNVMNAYQIRCGGIWVNGHGFSIITYPQLGPLVASERPIWPRMCPFSQIEPTTPLGRSNESTSSEDLTLIRAVTPISLEPSPRLPERSDVAVDNISLFPSIWEQFIQNHLYRHMAPEWTNHTQFFD